MSEWGRGRAPHTVAIVAADPRGENAAADAIALAGGAAGALLTWPTGDADSRLLLAGAADADALIVEVASAAAEPLASVLDACAMFAARGGAIIISFDPAQLDAVAAALLDSSAQLLCAPGVADRAAALAVALSARGGAGGRVREDGPESEAARLKRLNEEVARIADVLARIGRGATAARSPIADPVPGADLPQEGAGIAAADVRRVIRARRLRDQYFGAYGSGGLFEDPAWDMLLDLLAADIEGVRVSVSSLCIAAAVAPTTALRWVARMTEAGLLCRENDPADRRRAFMRLSSDAMIAMRRYWHAARRLGGPML
ncbi:hypothetical protein [Sphingomonas sp.]|uniref:hypothetical protein n=1 Tax=Sphingomonas sp. TaxID=28214 RepID=UPI0035A8727C